MDSPHQSVYPSYYAIKSFFRNRPLGDKIRSERSPSSVRNFQRIRNSEMFLPRILIRLTGYEALYISFGVSNFVSVVPVLTAVSVRCESAGDTLMQVNESKRACNPYEDRQVYHPAALRYWGSP